MGITIEELLKENEQLKAKLEKAKEALRFYGDYESHKAEIVYISTQLGQLMNIETKYQADAGDKARALLKEIGE